MTRDKIQRRIRHLEKMLGIWDRNAHWIALLDDAALSQEKAEIWRWELSELRARLEAHRQGEA
jgi:hypothetical protein